MVACVVLAVTVKTWTCARGTSLTAHCSSRTRIATLDGTTATRLPWLRTPQMHGFARLRESRASDNSESEIEARDTRFKDWRRRRETAGRRASGGRPALAVAFIEHGGARAPGRRDVARRRAERGCHFERAGVGLYPCALCERVCHRPELDRRGEYVMRRYAARLAGSTLVRAIKFIAHCLLRIDEPTSRRGACSACACPTPHGAGGAQSRP